MGTIECPQPASKSSWDSPDFGDISMVLKMAHFRKSTGPRWVNLHWNSMHRMFKHHCWICQRCIEKEPSMWWECNIWNFKLILYCDWYYDFIHSNEENLLKLIIITWFCQPYRDMRHAMTGDPWYLLILVVNCCGSLQMTYTYGVTWM